MLAKARDLIRSGNPSEALSILDDVRVRHPDGVLVQERELLSIEALVRANQRGAAVDRARSFLGTWPESPYARRVRELSIPP